MTSASPNSSIRKNIQPSPRVTARSIVRVRPPVSIRSLTKNTTFVRSARSRLAFGSNWTCVALRPASSSETRLGRRCSPVPRPVLRAVAPADRHGHQDPACRRTPDIAPQPMPKRGLERLPVLDVAELPARDVEVLEVEAGLGRERGLALAELRVGGEPGQEHLGLGARRRRVRERRSSPGGLLGDLVRAEGLVGGALVRVVLVRVALAGGAAGAVGARALVDPPAELPVGARVELVVPGHAVAHRFADEARGGEVDQPPRRLR